MSTYKNGSGRVPRLPEAVVATLVYNAGVSCGAAGPGSSVIDQTGNVECLVHDTCEELLARLPVPARRDREEDRARFPDPAFNRWLDEGISDAGHTVWDQIGDIVAAWAAWSSRDFYRQPTHTCIGKGGSYELLGQAVFAGELRNFDPVVAYRNVVTGQLFLRAPADFESRMQKVGP